MNVVELKYELIRRSVREDSFRIIDDIHLANEQYCLVFENSEYTIAYAEKGELRWIGRASSEAEACSRFLFEIERDPTTKIDFNGD